MGVKTLMDNESAKALRAVMGVKTPMIRGVKTLMIQPQAKRGLCHIKGACAYRCNTEFKGGHGGGPQFVRGPGLDPFGIMVSLDSTNGPQALQYYLSFHVP